MPYAPLAFAASKRQPLSRVQMLSRQLNCVLGSKPNDDIMLKAMDWAVPGSGAGKVMVAPPAAAAPSGMAATCGTLTRCMLCDAASMTIICWSCDVCPLDVCPLPGFRLRRSDKAVLPSAWPTGRDAGVRTAAGQGSVSRWRERLREPFLAAYQPGLADWPIPGAIGDTLPEGI